MSVETRDDCYSGLLKHTVYQMEENIDRELRDDVPNE